LKEGAWSTFCFFDAGGSPSEKDIADAIGMNKKRKEKGGETLFKKTFASIDTSVILILSEFLLFAFK